MFPDTLTCPACGHTAAGVEFVPAKLKSNFDVKAFVLLTFICLLALLKGLGVLR